MTATEFQAQMKIISYLKNLGKSILRIIAALAVFFIAISAGYLLWQPGSRSPLPAFDDNAIWLGHGWLGDDGWFTRNNRDMADFRGEDKCLALCRRLRDNHIATVYPHLCPAQLDGRIAAYDDEQVERFLDAAEQCGIKVIPWIGGVFEESARPADERWRRKFVASVAGLLQAHPRLDGVQVNIEPMPSGNPDFLKLLEELRAATTGKTLGVAAYPPPTRLHPFPDVHWELPYIEQVAARCDQFTVMMYDTSLPLKKFYISLMTSWTNELTKALRPTGCKLILGIPAYEDADVGYHRPQVENIASAMRGISAAKDKRGITGIAIYCEWEMDDAKWLQWNRLMPHDQQVSLP